jgi:CRISPR/Cas system CSM-associated protein Csm3 (group 7 of RAMP superfamily)
MSIKAPYNFVPLPEYDNAPYIPDWGNKVSLDYPFSDGVSGEFTLTMTAETDIFVRDSKEKTSFHFVMQDQQKRYFIPGSSIKGMLRSTLEIVTFGKLTQVNPFVDRGHQIPTAKGIPERFHPDNNQNDKLDMAELMFGYVNGNNALKGRVQVSHAFAQGEPHTTESSNYVLSTPNPASRLLYVTGSWDKNDPLPKIYGYKRYPTRGNIIQPSQNRIPESMRTTINALEEGTVFISTIRFHNLKPIELGALLYVITELDFHQLGGLKPYGYGKVKINEPFALKINGTECVNRDQAVQDYKQAFIEEFNRHYLGWQDSDTITELRAMATGIEPRNEDEFRYMSSSESQSAKEEGNALQYFSDINT